MAVSNTSIVRGGLSYKQVKEHTQWGHTMTSDYVAISSFSTDITIQVNENSQDIADLFVITNDLDARVTQNEDDIVQLGITIQSNFQYLHGDASESPDYSEAAGYTQFDKVTYTGNEYSAINDIAAPAGVFNPSLWRQVSTQGNHDFVNTTRTQSVQSFSAAGYAKAELQAPGLPGGLPAAWGAVPIDTDVYTSNRAVTVNLGSNSMAFGYEGKWNFDLIIPMRFDSSASARTLSIRVFNNTAASQKGSTIITPVDISASSAVISVSFGVEILDAEVGDSFSVQIFPNLAFTNFEYLQFVWTATRESESKTLDLDQLAAL